MSCNIEFIYRISWYETKKHRISHTNIYVITASETEWVFDTDDYINNLVKVELIKTCRCSQEYGMALSRKK